jgi:hypothetical protein
MVYLSLLVLIFVFFVTYLFLKALFVPHVLVVQTIVTISD